MSNEQIVQRLREKGFRLTPQRLVILEVLEEDGGHLSPAEVYIRAVKRMPGLTEPTVYRTLDFLARHGLALVAPIGDGHLVYEAAGRNHHHLICRSCGYTVEIQSDLLKSLYADFKEQTGFEIDCCHITFFGLCPGCIEK